MANAAFFVNDIKVKRTGKYLILQARKKCQHGTVFDEVHLTLPGELEYLFSRVEGDNKQKFPESKSNYSICLTELFKRFSSEN